MALILIPIGLSPTGISETRTVLDHDSKRIPLPRTERNHPSTRISSLLGCLVWFFLSRSNALRFDVRGQRMS